MILHSVDTSYPIISSYYTPGSPTVHVPTLTPGWYNLYRVQWTPACPRFKNFYTQVSVYNNSHGQLSLLECLLWAVSGETLTVGQCYCTVYADCGAMLLLWGDHWLCLSLLLSLTIDDCWSCLFCCRWLGHAYFTIGLPMAVSYVYLHSWPHLFSMKTWAHLNSITIDTYKERDHTKT